MSIFIDNLKKLISERGITQKKFLNDMGLNINAIGDWQKHGNVPKGVTLQRIANYFSVSVDYLLGESDEQIGEDVLDIVNGVEQYILEACNGDLNVAQRWQEDIDTLEAKLEASKALNTITADEKTLLDVFRQLSSTQQGEVIRQATRLLHQKWLKKDDNDTIQIRHSFYKVSAGLGFDLDEGDNWEMISVPDTPEARKADFALTIKGDSMEPVYRSGDIVLVKQQDAVDVGEIGIFIVDGSGYIKKFGGDRLISLNAEYDDILFKDYDSDYMRCAGKVIGRV